MVAALHDAGLNTNLRHQRKHGLDPDSDSKEDGSRPRVRIPPPIFKGLPGERPDAHLLAAEDWMEAMKVKDDDYVDKFKHTLHHLACEWYHGLDIDQFGDEWHEFTGISADISLHKEGILNICMKGGEPFHLIHLLMTSKNTSEM